MDFGPTEPWNTENRLRSTVSLPDLIANDAAHDGTTDCSDRTPARQHRARNASDTGTNCSVFSTLRHAAAGAETD
jgi:hypothetical protein